MATSTIDFSDLGGKAVQPAQVQPAQAQGGIDFSDLGGKRVDSPAQQSYPADC